MALGWIKITTLATALVWMSVGDVSAETARYDVDPDHSTIGFSVDHMVVSKTHGQFTEYVGFIEMDPDAKTVKAIEATIKTPSITTNHQKRDTHLKSPDFFDVEQYPTMSYKMKSYRKTGDGYTAIGDLTLHGVTKEITLVGNFNGVNKDPGATPEPDSRQKARSTGRTSEAIGTKHSIMAASSSAMRC
jgi:polyisoprenoid-binding protein YceI